jgi:hypothetical protein
LDAPLRLVDLPADRAEAFFFPPAFDLPLAIVDRRDAPALPRAFRPALAALRAPDAFLPDDFPDLPDERDLPDLVAAAPPTFFAMIAPSVLSERTRW